MREMSDATAPDCGRDTSVAGGGAFDSFLGMRDRSDRLGRADLGVLLALFGALVVAYFVPLIVHGGVLTSPGGDVAFYFVWARDYVGRAVSELRLPQWNPYIMCGTPFLASSQEAAFYPVNWLYAFLPVEPLINAEMIAHFWFGLATMHVLLRRLGRSVAASVVGALVFGFSGFAILHWWAGHLPYVVEWPWTPLAVLGWMKLEREADCGSRRGVVAGCLGLGVVISMQFFSGHPQIVYYTLLILVALQFGWIVYAIRVGHSRSATRGCSAFAVALGLSAAMAAIQALPSVSHAVTTVRSPTAVDPSILRNYYESLSQPPWMMLSTVLFCPFGGDRHPLIYLGGGASWEVVGFVGVTAFLLALACFVIPRRPSPLAWTLLVTLAFAWWLALGSYGWLFRTLFGVLPGLSLFRVPGRMIYMVTFCIAVLSAAGLDLLWRLACEKPPGLRPVVRRLGCLTTFIGLAYLVLFARREHSPLALWVFRQRLVPNPDHPLDEGLIRGVFGWFQMNVLIGFATAVAVIVMILVLERTTARPAVARGARWSLVGFVLAELVAFAIPYRETFSHAEQMWPAQLENRLRRIGPRYRIGSSRHGSDRNQCMVRGIRHIWGYEPTVSYRYGSTLKIAQTSLDGFPDAYLPIDRTSPFTQALGTRLFIDRPDTRRPPDPAWRLVAKAPTWSLYEDPLAIERGYTVARAETVTSDMARWRVNDADFQPTCTVLIEETPPTGFGDSATTSTPGTVHLVRDEPELLEAQVDMHSRGWFVLMDTLLPGWTVTVDGRPARIYRANAIGRALALDAGPHVVRMEYHAPGLAAGAWVSAAAWTAWLAGVVAVTLTRKRRQPAEPLGD